MQFSERWLRTLTDPPLDTAALCDAFTMAGLEVEQAVPAAPPFDGVVVGRIERVEPHPDADRLRVCTVDAGEPASLTIVCGAPNAVAGMKAPCARVGAMLPGGLAIRKTAVRGVESQGMLCSAKELGISDDASGLLALPDDAEVGADLRDALTLDDTIIELKVTPNRADCLSLVGLAREVSAATAAPLSLPEIAPRAGDEQVRTGGAGRGPGRMPALRVARDRRHRPQGAHARVDGRAPRAKRHPLDLGRRRHHQLRDARAGTAASRLRRCAARWHRRRPLRARRRNAHAPEWPGARARARSPPRLRREEAARARRHHGRRALRHRRRDDAPSSSKARSGARR